MTRVLIVGATGQVGIELVRARRPRDWTLLQPTTQDFDLRRGENVLNALAALKPDAVINAAGYTAVDRAKKEPEAAFALNRDGPAALAECAANLGAALVHISTDYVFSGEKTTPYIETDPIAPLGAYGRSKGEGEEAVFGACERSAIIRTSWVYSPHRSNFVKTMLRLSENRGEVNVVADQIGRPTGAKDLAAACIAMAEKLMKREMSAAGVFHYAGAGDATWADLAEFVFAEAVNYGRRPVRVNRISTAEYPTPARRPANSRLDTAKIEALGVAPRPWREAVRECLAEMLAR